MAFNYGIGKGHNRLNPAAKTDKPIVKDTKPEVLTPAQMRCMIKHATKGMLPRILIQGFAGLRTSEMLRLKWRDIDLEGSEIYVSDAGKTGERLVEIQPNLANWLQVYALTIENEPDRRDVSNSPQIFNQIATDAGIDPWPRNALRHSFASYLLAMTENAAKVAHQLGHQNHTGTLFRHYRRLVKKSEGQRWFGIQPKVSKRIVRIS